MTPGETGELFEELSGDGSGERLPEYCPLCGGKEGPEKHRCPPYVEDLRKARDFAGFIQSKPLYDVGNPLPVESECSSTAPGGWYCSGCQQVIPWGEGHSCRGSSYDGYVPDGNPGSTSAGYKCVFCGARVNYGEVHLCLYDQAQNRIELQEIKEGIAVIMRMLLKQDVEIVETWLDQYQRIFGSEQEINTNILLNHLRGWVDLKGRGKE